MTVKLHPLVAAAAGPQVRTLISNGDRWCAVCDMRLEDLDRFLVVPWCGRMDAVCIPCGAEFEHVQSDGVVCPTCFLVYPFGTFEYLCPRCGRDSWPVERVLRVSLALALAPAGGVA